MEFKRKRGNYLIIFERIIELPILIVGALASIVLVKNFDVQAIMPLVVILFSPISRLINYLFTFYTLKEDHLLIESGVFTKKRVEIPFTTVTTVDLSQNILFQFLKVYKIKVDNASQTNDTSNKSNIVLALKINDAIKFKEIISKGNHIEGVKEKEAEEASIKAVPQDFIKLGLLRSKWVYFFSVFAVVGPLFGIISPIINDTLKNMLVGVIIAILIVTGYVFSVALSLIKSVVTYYNFMVWATDEAVKIKYGLFNKKSYSLQKSKINGIILKQNLLMRLCGLYTIEVIVIGYGDSGKEGETEQAIIFPIASLEKIRGIVKKLLPEYHMDYSLTRPDTRALKYFFASPVYILSVIGAIVLVVVSINISQVLVAAAALLMLILSTVRVFLCYSNTGISVDNKNVVLSSGGFGKKVALIKTASIESIASTGNKLKRNRGFVSISLGYVAPARAARMTSYNLPVEQFTLLQGVLRY